MQNSVAANCYHCGLPLPRSLVVRSVIDDQQRSFCCHGCRQVCEIIHEHGMQGFYRRTPSQQTLAPPPKAKQDWQVFDLPEVQSPYVTQKDDVRSIELFIEGIHCAACVWLIERYLGKQLGVVEANVNFSRKRLLLSWRFQQEKLSTILQKLSEIGYLAEPYDPAMVNQGRRRAERALLFRMAFAGFAMMNLLWISIALYSGANVGEFRPLFHWVGLLLATPVLFYSGYPFLRGAYLGLKQGYLGMDLPIALGASVTYFYSLYIALSGSQVGEVYFDTVVNFIFIILLGRYLQSLAQTQAVDATHRLLALQPRAATVLRNGKTCLQAINTIRAGDKVLIKGGERIPVDAHIISGQGSIDESLLTGESAAIHKGPGDPVSAGTLNLAGVMQVEVLATLKDTGLGRMIQRLEEAQSSQSQSGQLAERIVPWFVASTLILAVFAFFLWLPKGIEFALMTSTAVMIITCPCAFGLATPMAMAVACGVGARHGVLIKNAQVLESMDKVDHFVFDKTGTLTEGDMQLRQIEAVGDKDHILLLLATLEQHSQHPIAKTIVDHVKANVSAAVDLHISEFHEQAGMGLSGRVGNSVVIAGNLPWLQEHQVQLAPALQQRAKDWQNQGDTCIHVSINGQECAVVGLRDPIREGAAEALTMLRGQGMQLSILSGDRLQVVRRVAAGLGGLNAVAEVLPEDKQRAIEQLQYQGNRVAFVGDGINDAAAIKRAHVGVALGSGAHASAEYADVILMGKGLNGIQTALQLSKRTIKTIKQNIFISFTYNVIMIPLAMMGWISPLLAAVSMPVSSLLVIGNAARIRDFGKAGAGVGKQNESGLEVKQWK